jgi:predicted small metal-binding protein
LEKSLACGDLVPGCKAVLNGKDEVEVMQRATAHAKSAHQMEVMSPDIVTKAKAAIKDRDPAAKKPAP